MSRRVVDRAGWALALERGLRHVAVSMRPPALNADRTLDAAAGCLYDAAAAYRAICTRVAPLEIVPRGQAVSPRV